MTDSEKVINGLEHCKIGDCVECPYDQIKEESLHGKHDKLELICNEQLTEDILSLLKEQEAKLLTFDECKKHYSIPGELLGDIKKYVDYLEDIDPLYLECNIEDEWVIHWRRYRDIALYLDAWREDYGKTWRCWTKKPTEEQKRSVKWDA